MNTNETKLGKKKNINLIDFYDFWLEIKKSKIEPLTYDNYLRYGKKIKEFFTDRNCFLSKITSVNIETFYTYLYSKNLSKNTVKHIHIALNQCFKYALLIDLIKVNPMNKVEKPKAETRTYNFYNSEQMKSLFFAIEKEKLKLPIMLSAIYGLRRSEVLGLKWKAIDFVKKLIHIEHKVVEVNINGKQSLYKSNKMKTSSSTRDLPLVPIAAELLKEQQLKNSKNLRIYKKEYHKEDEEYICVDNFGKLIKPGRLTHGFAKILKKYKLEKIRFHDLRHSCASIMLSNNLSMKQIQEWLGHSNYSTTANIYSHLDYKSKRNSANSVANSFSFMNEKYNLSKRKMLSYENLSEEEIVIQIKRYQYLLKKVRQKNLNNN